MVGRIHVLLMPPQSPGCFSQPFPAPRLCNIVQYSVWGEKEAGLYGSVHTAGEAKYPLIYSHLPPWDKSWVKKVCLGTKLYHLGGRMMVIKWNCSSHSLQCIQSQIIFCSNNVLEFGGLMDLYKGTVTLGWLSKLVFSGGKMAENSYSAVLMLSINLSMSTKNLCCDSDGDFIKSIDHFGQNWHLPTQSPPADEYCMSLHLFRISLISFKHFVIFSI